MQPACTRRDRALGRQPGAAIEDCADAIAVAREEAREDRNELRGQHAFPYGLRTEFEGTAEVGEEPGGHFPVLLEFAHMRHLQARSDVPVDVAHVVPGLVLVQVGEVHAEAAKERPVVPLQHAFETPDHRPLEAAQQAFRCVAVLHRLRPRGPARALRAASPAREQPSALGG